MLVITRHKFHLVNRSQLPFLASGFASLFAMGIVFYLHPATDNLIINWNNFIFHISVIALTVISLSWFIMIVFESGQGYHTLLVQKGLRFGFWLFLVSEGMLFFSFFWAYFHFSLNPSISMGHEWPAQLGIQHINPYKIPLFNTGLLLFSGVMATWMHRAILTTNFIWRLLQQRQFYIGLMATLVLGYIFLTCQWIEYSFGLQQSWMSNVYWSIFFMLTGFHGFHVIVGTLFLQFNFVRQYICSQNLNVFWAAIKSIHHFFASYLNIHLFIHKKTSKTEDTLSVVKKKIPKGLTKMIKNSKESFNSTVDFDQVNRSALILPQLSRYSLTTNQHIGLEAALYYWHFVDAVWILLYSIVYIWGNYNEK